MHKTRKTEEKLNKYTSSNSQNTRIDDKSESFKKKGHTSKFNQQKIWSKDKEHIWCYKYERWGHDASDWWYNKINQKVQYIDDHEAKIVQDDLDDEFVVVMVVVSEDQHKERSWFLDTCFSNHMTYHMNWLVKFDSTRKSKVRLV